MNRSLRACFGEFIVCWDELDDPRTGNARLHDCHVILARAYRVGAINFDPPLKIPPRALRVRLIVIRPRKLDRRKLEFFSLCHGGGLDAPPGFCSEIGTLLPMAPCGRSSL